MAASGGCKGKSICSKHVTMLTTVIMSFGVISCCLGHGGGDHDGHLGAKGGSCIESERRALLDIRSDMYDSGEIFSTWIGEDCCRWRGVACDNTTSHVIKLDLHYPYTRHSYTDDWDDDDDIYVMLKEMGASKVNPALRDLKHLKYLDLSMNNFFGSHIPHMIASLVHLEYLNLSNAMFDGLIPPQLGNLSNLHYLDLGGWGVNDLRADDLDWLSRISSLKYVDMSVVNLSKAINWLHQVNSIPSLEVLYLGWASLPYIPSHLPPFNLTSIVKLDLFGYSNLTTTILRWLSHASSLAYLDLSYCSGIDIESLQVTLGALSNLKELYLLDNRLEGEIFGMIMNVSRSLKYLDLSWNSLSGDMGQILRSLGPFGMIMNVSSRLKHLDLSQNSLSGDIGQILRSLGSLEYLALDYNKFNGDILEIVKNAPSSLQYLSLGFNHITGEISQTVKNLTNLEYLDLSYTNVTGGILMAFCDLINLKSLILQGNNISRQIPKTIGNLTSLEYLNLSYNNITGAIPMAIGDLINLESLRLWGNKISGQIPEIIGNLTNLKYLDLSCNNITGGIPTAFADLINLKRLILSENKISGQIPEAIGNLRNIRWLDLSDNFFSGQMPETFNRLYNLQILEVSYNHLTKLVFGTLNELCNLSSIYLSFNPIGGELTDLIDALPDCNQRANLDIYIRANNLSGIVPSSIGQLSALRELDISSNFLEGNITEAHFFKLTNLAHLDISYNSLNVILPNDWLPPFNAYSIIMSSCHMGTKFPAWIQTQTNLGDLSLSGVGLLGHLPTWFSDFSKGLWGLNLSSNNLNGPLPSVANDIIDLSNNSFVGPIPLSFANASGLEILHLSHNNINGSFSPFFCNLNDLKILDLSYNNLSGEIPTCNKSFPTSLQSLHLNHNNLSGRFPSFLKHCEQLVTLDLAENNLFDEIPTWVGENLLYLRVLSLKSNLFYGTIPVHIANLTSLQVLDLSSNHLSGSIPSSLGNCSAMVEIQHDTTSLLNLFNVSGSYSESIVITAKGHDIQYTRILSLVTSIDLSNNNLSGEIPRELTKLHGLHFLNLSKNHLRGTIPEKIGSMEQLESLDLSMNNLTGDIPSSLSSLTFLSHLNLSHNNLSGRIPTAGGQMSTFLGDPSIYDGNEYLCGTPLPECPGDAAHQSPAHEQKEKNGDRLETVWEITSIVMGFVVGFWSFVGTMIMKQSIRIAFFRFFDKAYDWCYVQLAVGCARLKSKRQSVT
ncbi:receptor-like protein EIX2 [Musa acuminata AAA Group]|uniref:receptor-like protein EIX2 n=1 Tax=Musa acuminata AAA Group TaxID=214697 RepID=UPI0031D027A2